MAVWRETDPEARLGIVICNFSQEGPSRLLLTVGETVHILRETDAWYYGYCVRNRSERGLFPKSYVHIKKCNLDNCSSTDSPVAHELPIVQEITSVLREWGHIWKDLYIETHKRRFPGPKLSRLETIAYINAGDRHQQRHGPRKPQGTDFDDIRVKMDKLLDWRRLLMSGKLTMDEIKELKQRVTNEIDLGNARLGLDLVVRDVEGNLVNPATTSTVSLYRQHKYVAQRIQERESAPKAPKKVTSFNMFVDIRNFVCYIGEDADILIGLYDAKQGRFISDEFIMKWGNHGMPKNIDLLNNLRVLFTDLGVSDLSREKVCLVCQVIRIGRMDLKEPDTKKQTKNLRRPFGVAVLDVTAFMKETVESDVDKQEFIPFLACGEKDFLDSLIRKSISANKEINHKGQGLFVSIQMLHGDLKQVQKEVPHLVNSNTAIARKMGFPEVILPGDVRNDLYVTLSQGEFKKGSKTADKNVEVTMCVCNSKGEVLQNVICEGAGGQMVSHYRSVIYYHEDKPKWSENIKVMVPLNDFYGSHLKFTFKHRSSIDAKDRVEKNFGVSYLRLMCDDGTTLRDTVHDMLVYKIDYRKTEDPVGYLKVPATQDELDKNIVLVNNKQPILSGALSWNQSDHFQISTLICSTKLTHNVDLMGMLKWRDNPAGLEDHLKKFMRVEGEEIVKSIQDTLDALFNILIQNANSELYDNLVFDAIVYVLNVVQSAKYEQFRPVLDVYIKENFSATLAYNTLLMVLKDYIEKAHTAKEHEQDRYIKAMKALEYIFRFIVRSRVLFAALNDNKGKQQFEMLLKQVFQSISHLMMNAQKTPTPIAVQGQLLKYLPQTIGDIITVFDPMELSVTLVEFLNAITPDRHIFRKLQCMNDLIHTAVFQLPECRKILLPIILSHVHMFMEKDQELEISVSILSDLMDLLFQDSVGSTVEDLSLISRKVLRTVIQAVIRMDRDSVLIGNTVAVMVSILRQMTKPHYMAYIDQFETEIDLMDFLMEILMAFQDLLQKGVYPIDWNEMIMLQNSVFLQALRYYSDTIRLRFITNFEYNLWNNYFHCAISFMTQDALQLERFTTTKRQKILAQYRDMRRETGFSLQNMWYSLGSHKIRFIPEIVGPVLEMTLLPETELRKKTIPIFFDMIHTEFVLGKRKNFEKFESEMITQLDVLVESGKGDPQYRDLFHDIMVKMCEGHAALHSDGVHFVNTVRELMQHLLEYRDVITEEIRENKMSCTVNLLNFYKKLNRQEMYIRYLHKLCMLHLECDNYTEAACTLMLYARLLKWSDEPLPVILQSSTFPLAQTHRDLKEKLYYEIINYFDKGKMWEKGLELCKELAEQYETQTFDYIKLSQLLQRQAKFYDYVVRPDIIRAEPEYFRVGYFGLGFPSFLQNKVFIYRGKGYEKLLAFSAHIQNIFPTAQLMKTLSPPSEEIKSSNSQFLQINAVKPIMELKPQFKNKKVLDEILKYYKVNEVQQFTFSKKRDEFNSDVTKLWLEKTSLISSQPFPGILQWFPVQYTSVCDVSPLENAIDTMSHTNEKLLNVVNRHISDSSLRVDELERILGGVVDAAVNGGINNYKYFYSEEFSAANHSAKDQELVNKLRDITTNQMIIIKKGLELHGSKAPDDLRPYHEHMEARFTQMKEFVKKDFGIHLTEDQYGSMGRSLGLLSPTISRTYSIPRQTRSEYVSPDIKPETSSTHTTQRSMSIVNLPQRMTDILKRVPSTSTVVKDSNTKVYTRVVPSTLLSPKRNSVEGGQSNKSDDSETSQSVTSTPQGGASGSARSETSTPTKSEKDRESQVIELREALTPARPLRPENGRHSRPTSGQFKLGPIQTYSVVIDDEAPPPLPDKQSHADYMNLSSDEEDISPTRTTSVRARSVLKPAAALPPGVPPIEDNSPPPALPPKAPHRQKSTI